MVGAVETAFIVGAGGKWSYKDRRMYAYIDDDPRSAFVPPYVISRAWRCNGGGVVIPAARSLPARETPLRPPKLFRNDLIICRRECRGGEWKRPALEICFWGRPAI